MAKKRRKTQSNNVDRVVKKKGKAFGSAVRNNPFEVRINRQKHDVLGQKREKGERGLPGISRSRALEKVKTN